MTNEKPGYLYRRAIALAQLGQEAEAIDGLVELLMAHPTYWKAAAFLAIDLKAPLTAIASRIADRAVEEAGRDPAARGGAVRVLVRLGCPDEARELVDAAGPLEDAAIADAAFDLAVNTGDPALALRALQERKWQPGTKTEKDVWRLGLAMLKRSRKALLPPFERLLAAGNIQLSAGLALGRYAEVFAAEWTTRRRREIGKLIPNLYQPGESLEALAGAKVLIIAYTELGDEIRLIELVDRIRPAFGTCAIEVDRRIAELVARGRPDLTVTGKEKVAPAEGSAVPVVLRRHLNETLWKRVASFDRVFLIRDLQPLMIRSVDDLPRCRRSLEPDEHRRAMWRAKLDRLGPRPWIGLFWRSGGQNFRSLVKATHLTDWAPVFRICRGNYVNLQFGAGVSQEISAMASRAKIFEMPALNVKDDIDSVAALMCELDLVLTTPGTTQHLAGAMGARTLGITHPSQALSRARPHTNVGTWSPNVEVVSGPAGQGFHGAIAAAASRMKAILGR